MYEPGQRWEFVYNSNCLLHCIYPEQNGIYEVDESGRHAYKIPYHTENIAFFSADTWCGCWKYLKGQDKPNKELNGSSF